MGDTYPKFRVAAVQVAPVLNDRDACLAKAVTLIEEAGTAGADLIVFPETWLPGYPFWAWQGQKWGSGRGAAANPMRDRYAQLHANAIDIPGPATDILSRAARSAGAYLVMGLNERDTEFSRGTLYNTQLFIDRDGTLLGKHRKLMPTGGERLVWGRGDGSTLGVFDTEIGRLGGLICWEHWMPAAREAMHSLGEQVHVTQWPSVGELHQIAARHYAFEGRTFVISVGSYLTTAQLPMDFPYREDYVESDSPVIHNGGTAIIGPDGMYIAGPVFDSEQIVYGEIDLGLIARNMMGFDASGHYARPDVFTLLIRERKLVPVSRMGAPGAGVAGSDGLAAEIEDLAELAAVTR